MKEASLPKGELTSAALIAELENQVSIRTQHYFEHIGTQPELVIISTDLSHDGSDRYTRMKANAGARLGIHVEIKSPQTTDDVFETIAEANDNPFVNGVIVQLPLASKIAKAKSEILASVDTTKDVDGLGPEAEQIPATARAVDLLLKHYGVNVEEHQICLIGLGELVNGPLYNMWDPSRDRNNITGVDLATPVFERIKIANDADVIISATGDPSGLTPGLFLTGTRPKTLVDAGTAGTAKAKDQSQHGDVSDELRKYALENGWAITPTTGGVGPLTVRALMLNTISAAEKQAGISGKLLSISTEGTSSSHRPVFSEPAPNDRAYNPAFLPSN